MKTINLQLFGSRGSSSGRNGGGSGVSNSPEYRESYQEERDMRLEEAAVSYALPSQNRADDWIETQMIDYASAMGDPVRAMERQRESIQRELVDYEEAVTASNIGTRDAMREMVSEYDSAIERMRRIRQNSRNRDLMS